MYNYNIININKYKLAFTTSVQQQFINDNEEYLIEQLKIAYEKAIQPKGWICDIKRNLAIQQVIDNLHTQCNISIAYDLLNKLEF